MRSGLRFVGLCLALATTHCRSKSAERVPDRGQAATTAASQPNRTHSDGSIASCDSSSETACGPGRYCHDELGLCGKGPKPGTCRPRPERCAPHDEPVCACNRNAYPNECAARQSGVDVSGNGGCGERISGRIACGPRYCDARSTYCEIVLSDVQELPTTSSCRALPKSCMLEGREAPECGCFPAGTRCSGFCSPVETGTLRGFRLTCVGGY